MPMPSARVMTETFQNLIDTAAAQGGGRVIIPPGLHHCGSLQLRSIITLHLTAGAQLRAAVDDPELFKPVAEHDESLTANSDFGALLQAHGCRNLSITGPDTIDGAGDEDGLGRDVNT